jgi:hypothetical protein
MPGIMQEEYYLTLWQVDQARTDFAAIEEKLDFHRGATRRAAGRSVQASRCSQ